MKTKESALFKASMHIRRAQVLRRSIEMGIIIGTFFGMGINLKISKLVAREKLQRGARQVVRYHGAIERKECILCVFK